MFSSSSLVFLLWASKISVAFVNLNMYIYKFLYCLKMCGVCCYFFWNCIRKNRFDYICGYLKNQKQKCSITFEMDWRLKWERKIAVDESDTYIFLSYRSATILLLMIIGGYSNLVFGVFVYIVCCVGELWIYESSSDSFIEYIFFSFLLCVSFVFYGCVFSLLLNRLMLKQLVSLVWIW